MQTLKLMYIPKYTNFFFAKLESDLKAQICDITDMESKLRPVLDVLHITLYSFLMRSEVRIH